MSSVLGKTVNRYEGHRRSARVIPRGIERLVGVAAVDFPSAKMEPRRSNDSVISVWAEDKSESVGRLIWIKPPAKSVEPGRNASWCCMIAFNIQPRSAEYQPPL